MIDITYVFVGRKGERGSEKETRILKEWRSECVRSELYGEKEKIARIR